MGRTPPIIGYIFDLQKKKSPNYTSAVATALKPLAALPFPAGSLHAWGSQRPLLSIRLKFNKEKNKKKGEERAIQILENCTILAKWRVGRLTLPTLLCLLGVVLENCLCRSSAVRWPLNRGRVLIQPPGRGTQHRGAPLHIHKPFGDDAAKGPATPTCQYTFKISTEVTS